MAVKSRKSHDKLSTQSIIFDKKDWTYREASKWLRDEGYKNSRDEDDKTDSYRFRQQDPKNFSKFVSKKLPNGITLVLGK